MPNECPDDDPCGSSIKGWYLWLLAAALLLGMFLAAGCGGPRMYRMSVDNGHTEGRA